MCDENREGLFDAYPGDEPVFGGLGELLDDIERAETPWQAVVAEERWAEAFEVFIGRKRLDLPDGHAPHTLAEMIAAHKQRAPGDLTEKVWLQVLAAFEWRCAYCGNPYSVIEHVVPAARGGRTSWNNVVPACSSCNDDKWAHNPEKWISEKPERLRCFLRSVSNATGLEP
jgi:hypothetical protein